MLKELLVVFYHPAVEGAGKPGLVRTLGEERALVVQRQLLAHTRALAGQLADSGREVVFAADRADAASWRELHLDGFPIVSQGSGSSRERLAHVTTAAFAGGVDRLALVLADCPSLGAADINSVFIALANADVVVIPAEDGGCVVLGVSGDRGELFGGGSEPLTVASVRERAGNAGLRIEELPARWTVETEANLQKAVERGLLHFRA